MLCTPPYRTGLPSESALLVGNFRLTYKIKLKSMSRARLRIRHQAQPRSDRLPCALAKRVKHSNEEDQNYGGIHYMRRNRGRRGLVQP
jgi:hypothetical protein